MNVKAIRVRMAGCVWTEQGGTSVLAGEALRANCVKATLTRVKAARVNMEACVSTKLLDSCVYAWEAFLVSIDIDLDIDIDN